MLSTDTETTMSDTTEEPEVPSNPGNTGEWIVIGLTVTFFVGTLYWGCRKIGRIIHFSW